MGTIRERVTDAVAQAWCEPQNAHKVMDADLALSIVDKVMEVVDDVLDPPRFVEGIDRNKLGTD